MFTTLTGHPWAYPALEVLHLLGIAVLLGNLVLLEWRVWVGPGDDLAGAAGAGGVAPPPGIRALPLPALAHAALPLALGGFALAALSGLTMFATQPQELLANRAFTLKFVLLGLAGANAAAFHARGGLARADRLARAQTVLSLGLWLGVLVCGRWIAYV